MVEEIKIKLTENLFLLDLAKYINSVVIGN